MTEVLHHSPASPKQEDPIVEYRFVENELVALDEVFNYLFEQLTKEESL